MCATTTLILLMRGHLSRGCAERELWLPESVRTPERGWSLQALEAFDERPAVFAVHLREGEPYVGRTALLGRRLRRLLGPRAQSSRLLNLAEAAVKVERQYVGSSLEAIMVFYAAARRYHPETYTSQVRLRMPFYLKMALADRFPRSYVTSRLTGGRSLYYGPFRTRAVAQQFEERFLDLFQIRRCNKGLSPAPDYPGCIYGEMRMCLRPCQQAVSEEEYASEAQRAAQFLATGGRSLLDALAHTRERLSQEMHFEEAARLHRQVAEVEQAVRLGDGLAADIDRLNGVAVTRSVEPRCVELWFLLQGRWLRPRRLQLEPPGARPVSLDRRLRELSCSLQVPEIPAAERQEHLALLVRWRCSSVCEGEWLPFDDLTDLPFRRLVRAISRAAAAQPSAPDWRG